MRYLIFLGHPAHYHLFKNIIKELKNKGHEIKILVRTKDILEDLCIRGNIDYVNVLPEIRKNTLTSIIHSYLLKYKRIGKVIKSFKPNLLLGSEPSLTHLGKLFNIPSFIFSEDDVAIIPQFAKIAYPFVDAIISPSTCDAGKWESKKIGYEGFHKLTYLHPQVFVPDKGKIAGIIKKGDYFILRFAELNAYHDDEKTGITDRIAEQLINKLSKYGQVFISSERLLPSHLEKYRLPTSPSIIHHVLAFAKMYIGDSQSMAVESALLGTPGIRFNDFAGEIGVLNELEEKYGLTRSFKTFEEADFMDYVDNLVSNKNISQEYAQRRINMLKDKINTKDFFIWFIENYPESKNSFRKNPAIQFNFK